MYEMMNIRSIVCPLSVREILEEDDDSIDLITDPLEHLDEPECVDRYAKYQRKSHSGQDPSPSLSRPKAFVSVVQTHNSSYR